MISQIQEVIGFCCDFLFSWLDDDNILEVFKLADMYNLDQLGARVHSYLLKNIQTFSRTSVYRQLPSEKVFGVLSSDDLEVDSENEVYEAALHYHYSPEQVETDQVCLQVQPPGGATLFFRAILFHIVLIHTEIRQLNVLA